MFTSAGQGGLQALKRPSDYRAARPHVFPSDGSLEWFLRQNRVDLIERRALVKVGGRWFVNEALLDAAIVGAAQPA